MKTSTGHSLKRIQIQDIGIVNIRKRKGIKNLSIRIKPGGEVSVSIPYQISFSEAIDFVIQKKSWINKSLEKMEGYEQQKTLFKPGELYKTRNHSFSLKSSPRKDFLLKSNDDHVSLFYPLSLENDDQKLQEAARWAMEEIWRKEAKAYLPERVKMLSKKYGFSYNRIFIKNLKSRWGSCSNQDNINLNLQLMRLPDRLIDYVILHELTHTVHKNHGPNFWRTLTHITGDARAMAKEIKQYSTRIY